jgi:trigger factor
LKIEKQFTEDHQAKLIVEMEPQHLEAAKQRAARKIAQRVKIPGFRPGKAPYPVILRTVGEAAILDEAMEFLVNENYPKIIEEAGIKPYGPGNLENIQKLDPPVLEFLVPLEAEVTLGDYQAVRFPYEPKPVTEEDVEQTIEDLRDRLAVLEPVDRAAEEGDQVFIHLSSERKEVKEGQSLTLIKDREVPVTINPADKDVTKEWPFPGFSRTLLSLKPGDEKVIEYTYPEDAHLESLRGTTAIFRIKVDDIKLRKLPELNDEFAQSVGEFETFEDLRKMVKENLERQGKSEHDEEYNSKVINEILKDTQVKYPPQMLENEIDLMIRQLESRLSEQKLDMPTYLKTRRMEEADLRKELSPAAEERMKRSLTIFEIARAEEIKVAPEELQNETMRTLDSINRIYSPKEARKMVSEPFINNMVTNIAADLTMMHTLERLQNIAKGEVPAGEEKKPKKPKKAAAKKAAKAEIVAEAPPTEETTAQVQPESPSEGTAPAEPEKKPKRAKKVKTTETVE